MSLLSNPRMAALAARAMQGAVGLGERRATAGARERWPELPRRSRELRIPTSVGTASALVYLPPTDDPSPVHVNFHGGGYVLASTEMDDPLCRYLAAEAGVTVVNVDYVVAPQHPFPAAPHQAYEVVRWVAEHGADQGWDGDRLTIGGQSAGGGLAAAVARLALERGGPRIALQVLHYPPLDLATSAKDKSAVAARPMLKPWMAEVFDGSYVPDPRQRTDRLVSPANPADTADLTGIAAALVITAELDLLRDEGDRYAERLRRAGALVEHHVVQGADHGYDGNDDELARQVYARIARQVGAAVV
ncbi:alpha/beta hydrolase fold domain-containing protein [Nocardioides astragali]|uniref:Alpha/beta hydrolase fold domain-containing protein n=1 Tax=Nocardioides astragali TaxID=1776736 RepID=A0ABW2NAR0_9ACTN|nr:alpha/beta hydrolase fold domain-containing protein [Nocardioides astragali]